MTNLLDVCPRCGQGPVVMRKVIATAELIAVCEECEAVWPAPTEPSPRGFEDLGEFLAARGLTPEWSNTADPGPLGTGC